MARQSRSSTTASRKRAAPRGDASLARLARAGIVPLTRKRARGGAAARVKAWREPVPLLLLVLAVALLGWQPVSQWAWNTVVERVGPVAGMPASVNVRFAKCAGAGQQNCVIDGDTLRFSGVTVRIADIDAPETRDYKCASEKARGDRATQRLLQLVNAGPFVVAGYERDEDKYGRKLRLLVRDGESLGDVLVSEGLARAWDGARHPWC